MSDGWFDRSYRSEETPPAELDARILAAACRATRRWTVPVFAAGASTIAAAVVLGLLITGHELYVPSGDRARLDATTGKDGFRLDDVRPPTEPGVVHPKARPEMHVKPDGIPSRDLRAELAESQEAATKFPELDCKRSVLIGPLGGLGRRDLVQICASDGMVHIEVVWDGEQRCPSRLEVETPADATVSLIKRDLVVAQHRYRCEGGEWIRADQARSGNPVVRSTD